MHEFSAVDGFVEITENLADMIKYIANEPSVGLFYIQQHTQNAVPNVMSVKNNVVEKSRETALHTEDLEDSVTMMRSMKECGFPIANEMIKDIKESLTIMSTKQPRRGLIHNPNSDFQIGRASPWGHAIRGRNSFYADESSTSYFSTVFKSARQKASSFKWTQFDAKKLKQMHEDKLLFSPTPPLSIASASTNSSMPDLEADELPISSEIADEIRKETDEIHEEDEQEDEDSGFEARLPHSKLIPESENYEDFKANKEAKLEEWLGGNHVDSKG